MARRIATIVGYQQTCCERKKNEMKFAPLKRIPGLHHLRLLILGKQLFRHGPVIKKDFDRLLDSLWPRQ